MRRTIRAALAGVLAFSLSAAAWAAGAGSSGDPMITLSKLRSVYLDTVKQNAQKKADSLPTAAAETLDREYEKVKALLQAKAEGLDVDQVARRVQQQTGAGTGMVNLKKGIR